MNFEFIITKIYGYTINLLKMSYSRMCHVNGISVCIFRLIFVVARDLCPQRVTRKAKWRGRGQSPCQVVYSMISHICNLYLLLNLSEYWLLYLIINVKCHNGNQRTAERFPRTVGVFLEG